MSNYANQAVARPRTTSIAVVLLCLAGASEIVLGGIDLAFVDTISAILAYDGWLYSSFDTAWTTVIATGVINIVFGSALTVLAVFVGRGSRPARVLMWSVAAVVALCGVCGLMGTGASMVMDGTSVGDDGPLYPVRVAGVVERTLPAWHVGIQTTAVMLLAVAAILLALPTSKRYFRKPERPWKRPAPSAATPSVSHDVGPATWTKGGATGESSGTAPSTDDPASGERPA